MKAQFGILGAMLVAGSVHAAEGVSVGGFVDAQYNWAKNDGAATTNTFTVPDGALYLNGKSGMTEVLVDVPFHSSSTSDDFLNFQEKGQAWVGAKYDSGLNWKLGQFDTTYTYEKEDSHEIVFTKAGLLKEVSGLTVHRGLNLGYDFSDMLGLSLLVANPHTNTETGAVGGDMTGGNPDFGAQVSANMDTFNVKVGGLFGKNKAADKMTYLVNAQAGFNVAQLNIGLEFITGKQAVSFLGAAPVFVDEVGFGIGGHIGYQIDDMINVATRIEWFKIDETKLLEWTVGPQFKLSDALTAKVDYTLEKYDTVIGDATNHIVNIGAVHKF